MNKVKTGITKSTSTPVLAAKATATGGSGISLAAPKKPAAAVVIEGFSDAKMDEFLQLSEEQRVARVDALLRTSAGVGAIDENSRLALAQIVNKTGLLSAEGAHVVSRTMELVRGSDAGARECGLRVLGALVRHVGHGVEPFATQLFPALLALATDRVTAVRELSAVVVKEFLEMNSPNAFQELIYPHIKTALREEDWRSKVAGLQALRAIAPRASTQLSPLLPDIIPLATDCILDAKKQVQTAGVDALIAACHAITNDDIRPLVPQLVSVIAHPDESEKTLNLLLETTFVATVDAAVLALIAPLLGKSLKNRSSAMKRKASRVMDIMCRLVQVPSDVAPFVPLLLPSLDRVIDELVDAEVCEVAKAAREILLRAMSEGFVNPAKPIAAPTTHLSLPEVAASLSALLLPLLPSDPSDLLVPAVAAYIVHVAAQQVVQCTQPNPLLLEQQVPACDVWRTSVAMVRPEDWATCITPYLKTLFGAVGGGDREEQDTPAHTLAVTLRSLALGDVPDNQFDLNGDDASLCNIEFSLAFGGKILLHNTHLRLGKGRRYGLLGKNGAGKTTLLTNIGSGNIEGLPTHLKMVYVQHDNVADDMGVPVVEELLASRELAGCGVTAEHAADTLKGIGFTEQMLAGPRSLLSGGWKMKLLIIKALLARADVLLLDEPTNHLDAASVEWLTQYILSQKEVTCLVVSHDTVFLDRVLTDVIHYEEKKLVYYHGNLTHFVSIHPEAKYYYELNESTLRFVFPTPERLEGINSNTRSIIKLENCQYTYPGASEPQLRDVNVRVCLGSRIAVVGANGAGKSTLIKMLVQETTPDENTSPPPVVWKHMNLRIAYVAQHSFHHVEQHLDASPVDYIKWRFSGGVDKEDMAKPTTALSEDEAQDKKRDRKYGDVEEVHGRRKNGRTMEYECSFVGQNPLREPNKYIALEDMVAMGLQKLVTQCDTKIAAMAAGLDLRPLVTTEIQGHLNDFALEAEFGTHSTIRRLSGGQKVKLVLAAAMWNRPHVLVCDEPTNYLDREALGALTQAIKDFGGGVLIISHNKEFTDALCNEHWLVRDGVVYTEGGVEEAAVKALSANKIKKSQSAGELKQQAKDEAVGNINSTIASEVILNPRTLDGLSKKEARKLERCAAVAGVSLKEYVSKITCKSPEWKWL